MHPVLFYIGPIIISPLSLMAVVAFFITTFIFWQHCRKSNVDDDSIFDLVIILFFTTIIFGRLQYVLLHFGNFKQNILRIFLFLKYPGFGAGLVIVVSLIIIYIFSVKRKISILTLLDNFSFGLATGLSIIYLGFFLTGVGAGSQSKLPWAFTFPGLVGTRHPLSLYEMTIYILLFLIYIWLKRRFTHYQSGVPTFLFILFWGFSIFSLEFLRIDDIYFLFGVRIGYIFGLLTIVFGAIMLSKKGFFSLIKSTRVFHFSLADIKNKFLSIRK